MNSVNFDRKLSVGVTADIGILTSNRSAAYAKYWLSTLGAPGVGRSPNKNIVIVGGNTQVTANCVIRLWDYQVGYPGCGTLASAVSGAAAVIGQPDGPGVPLPGDIPEKWCGIYGVIVALAEIWRNHKASPLKKPIRYDISAADIMRSFSLQNAGPKEEMLKTWHRNGHRCVQHGGIFPMGFYGCKDGYVALLGRSRRDWHNIRMAIGDPLWARAEAFQDPFALAADSAEADRLMENTLVSLSRDELLYRGLAENAVIAPVYSQLEASKRDIFRERFMDGNVPNMPFLIRELGTKEIKNKKHLQTILKGDVESPLMGLRCLELCWVWSGPMVGQILADLGAEVIKVEAPKRFDLYRTRGLENRRMKMPEKARIESSLYFHSLNRNKHGLALDLKQSRGRDIALRLASVSDLLIENFTVGTMESLGLDVGTLSKANPALVQLSMSGPGKGSAVEKMRSYGLVLSALGGAEDLIQKNNSFLGSPTFSLSDPNAAVFGTLAALIGALAAKEDGKGRSFDLSQIEAAAALAGTPTLPEKTLGDILTASDGTFIAVTVPVTAFSDLTALRDAFSGLSRAEIMDSCSNLGGHTADLLALEDTQNAEVFADCSGYIASNHPYTGDEMLVASPWRINGARPQLRKNAPLLGGEDEIILQKTLGLEEDAISDLKNKQVIGIGNHFDEETI